MGLLRLLFARPHPRVGDGCPDRGSSAVEFTIVFPIIVLILFAGPQLAMWFYAREAAQHAAVAAARAAAVQGAPAGTGATVGEQYLAELDSGAIDTYTVTEQTTATTVTLRIRVTVPNVVPLPGFDPSATITLVRDRERFTTVDTP